MNKLQQWIYAYKVCKKYNLKLRHTFYKDFGYYTWGSQCIYLDWFSKHFMSIFLHEVGHHVEDRKVDYTVYFIARHNEAQKNGMNVWKSLKSEAFASRFAAKTGKSDRKFLIECFNTYSADVLRKPYLLTRFDIFEKIVDTIEYCSRRIEK